jgi:hypothetical protein
MKNICVIIICLVLFSCDVEEETYTNYIIENKSGHAVGLFVQNYEYAKDSIFSINSEDKIVFSYTINYGKADPFFYSDPDTVILIFDNEYVLSYTVGDTSSRNLLFNDNYDEVCTDLNGDTRYDLTYTITEEDYNNAVLNEE